MHRPAALAALVSLVAGAAAAAPAMTPQAFEAASAGRTLRFTYLGDPFGAEQYLPGRRVLWRFEDGTCQSGRWWDAGDLICFAYDGGDGPQCWRFHPRASGFAAALVQDGAETGFVLDLSATDDAPLDCPGPDLGT